MKPSVALALALGLAVAAPAAIAQPAAPAAPVPPQAERPALPERPLRGPRFAGMSAEGRQILAAAMRAEEGRAERAQVRAARDRIHALLVAERLDVAALRRAMEEERRLVDRMHAARQARMLEAFQRLSPADRRIFAENAMRGRRMAEGRAEEWRAWAEQVRERMRDLPPPPAPPVPPSPGTF